MNREMFMELMATMPGGSPNEKANALRLAEFHGWGYEAVWTWMMHSGWRVFTRPDLAHECFSMLRAIGAPPEYAIVLRRTVIAEDAAVFYTLGVPATYAVLMGSWGVNATIQFHNEGVEVGYAMFAKKFTSSDIVRLTRAGCPAAYASAVGAGAREVLAAWEAGIPVEYATVVLDESLAAE